MDEHQKNNAEAYVHDYSEDGWEAQDSESGWHSGIGKGKSLLVQVPAQANKLRRDWMERIQCCRHCCYLRGGGTPWCSRREEAVSRAAAGSPNGCHSFAYTPVDALGGGEETLRRRRAAKKQCDGQIGLF